MKQNTTHMVHAHNKIIIHSEASFSVALSKASKGESKTSTSSVSLNKPKRSNEPPLYLGRYRGGRQTCFYYVRGWNKKEKILEVVRGPLLERSKYLDSITVFWPHVSLDTSRSNDNLKLLS